jgi:hypothetical protein
MPSSPSHRKTLLRRRPRSGAGEPMSWPDHRDRLSISDGLNKVGRQSVGIHFKPTDNAVRGLTPGPTPPSFDPAIAR